MALGLLELAIAWKSYRVIVSDGFGLAGFAREAPQVHAGMTVEIGDVFRASITAKDIDRLMVREITINGETIQVLVPN